MNFSLVKKYKQIPLEVKASFWFLICSFFQRGISVITTPIFTRLMTTAEYGEFNVFYSWYGIIMIFTTFNLFFGVYVRGLIVYDKEKERFTSSMQGLMLTLVLVWFIVYLLFQEYINKFLKLSTFQIVSMFIIIWTNGVFNFWAAYKRVELKYKELVCVSMLTSICMPIAQIILIKMIDNSVNARILGMLIVSVLFYPALFIIHMYKGKCFFDKKIWKHAISFNLPLIPHYFSQTILNSADRIMINDMVGNTEAGIYSLAYSISQIMTVFNLALMQTIEPWLYKKIKNNEVEKIKKIAYPSFLIVAILNIILIILAPEAVRIFAPKEYNSAIWVIPPIAMSVFFTFCYTFFAVFEFYYKKTQYITMATIIGAIINIILNYYLINIFGYFAAGYTTLLCYILYAIFHYLFMKKLIKNNLNNQNVYDTKILLIITIAFLIIGFLIMSTYEMIYLRYGFILIITIVLLFNIKKITSLMKKIIVERK